jgi:YNFM family putative membrane transporter
MLCSLFTFFVLYGPQPILPLLSEHYDLSVSQAGLLMTVTMLPLAIAPLVYGYILLKVNTLKLLKWALAGLALTCFLLPLSRTFEHLLIIRLLQGLLLPAALTAMTSYIGQHYRFHFLSKAITAYILSTIAGGFLSRIVSSAVSEYTHWQIFFYALALLLGGLAISLQGTKTRHYARQNGARQNDEPVPLKQHLNAVFKGQTLSIYSAVFGMFFCFTALLNYLPFILINEYDFSNSRDIGLVYSGYLIGAVFSLLTPMLQMRVRGKLNLLLIIFVIYALSISSLFSVQFVIFFIGFTVFCGAMFIIHASASALLNQISLAPSSLTNALYVSFYYCGGTLGSFLPGLVYQHFGKNAFLLLLLLVCALSTVLVANFKRVKQSSLKV